MRRGLAFVALVFILMGLELSTEAVSLVVDRLGAGFTAIGSGAEFHVTPLRFVVGVLGLIFGIAIWVLLIWSARKRGAVAAVGGSCPQCGNETRRVKRREWQRLLSALLGERLTRRKCDTCGWVGLSLKH